MNKYLASVQGEKKELKGPVKLQNPAIYEYSERVEYATHLASLPVAFTNVSWLKESDDGRILEEGKDFEIRYTKQEFNKAAAQVVVPINEYKQVDEKDLIIYGLEEGAMNWKWEYDRCRAILRELVQLKEIKDTVGKTDDYQNRQPLAWETAKQFLSKYKHL